MNWLIYLFSTLVVYAILIIFFCLFFKVSVKKEIRIMESDEKKRIERYIENLMSQYNFVKQSNNPADKKSVRKLAAQIEQEKRKLNDLKYNNA